MKRKGAKGFAIKAVDADGLAKKAGGIAKGDCEYQTTINVGSS